jgi:rhamnulokinase
MTGSTTRRVVAVDLGATSGRVMVAEVGADVLELIEVHRFRNGPVEVGGSLHWDVLALHREILAGLRLAAAGGPVHGIGIDSWAVDYGLLDAGEQLLGNPYSYRDSRTDGVAATVLAEVGAAEMYAVTGLQQLPFNTVYQLVAAGTASLVQASTLLLLPDLFGYWLTGRIGAEATNASTTGLYDVRSRAWALDLADRVGIRSAILPPLRAAGDLVGTLLPDVAEAVGLGPDVPVIAVGSHDTASAVVAVPADGGRSAYLSSGTWSLIGLELDEPVLSEDARLADFTNEGGVDGTVRFLKNVMGLWVLSESLDAWARAGVPDTDLAGVLAGAAAAEPLRTVVDINDRRLLSPGTTADSMPARVQALAREAREPVPETPAQVTRCILDSLVLAYRRHLHEAAAIAGRTVDVLHVVGGGSQNALLCQLTADACGVPVLAGPVEASALGNVLVQARTLGVELPDLAAMRALVRRTHALRRYEPRPGVDWDAAQARLRPAVAEPSGQREQR